MAQSNDKSLKRPVAALKRPFERYRFFDLFYDRLIFEQVVPSLCLLFSVVSIGTFGYVILEGWPVFDALYMTVITITTIGFGEIRPLSATGRAFTIFLIFFSVGAVFYSLNNAAKLLLEGELKNVFGRRRTERMINGLKEHYILCGFGRMGKIIARELSANGADFVVVEKNMQAKGENDADILIVEGDATKDETLQAAGIEYAKGLISVLSTDAENLYVVLSARGMNPKLQIVARASEEGSEQKLIRAGADRVVSPYIEGGMRIAHTLLKPAVVDFIEVATNSGNIDLQMEEIKVESGSTIAGMTLDKCGIGRELGIIIVAIKKGAGEMSITPTHSTVIEPGDTLIALGEANKLSLLEAMSKRS